MNSIASITVLGEYYVLEILFVSLFEIIFRYVVAPI